MRWRQGCLIILVAILISSCKSETVYQQDMNHISQEQTETILKQYGGIEGIRSIQFYQEVENPKEWLLFTNLDFNQADCLLKKDGSEIKHFNGKQMGTDKFNGYQEYLKYNSDHGLLFAENGEVYFFDDSSALYAIDKNDQLRLLIPNIINIDRLSFNDNKLYFIATMENDNGLFVLDIATNHCTKIDSGDISEYQVVNGIVYYILNSYEVPQVQVIQYESGNKKNILTTKRYIEWFHITGDMLYYIPEYGTILKVNLSAPEQVLVKREDATSSKIYCDDQWIYLWSEGSAVYKMDMNLENIQVLYVNQSNSQIFKIGDRVYGALYDGLVGVNLSAFHAKNFDKQAALSNSDLSIKDKVCQVQVEKEHVYYINADNKNQLFQADTNWTNPDIFIKKSIFDYTMDRQAIYYTVMEDNFGIWKYDKESQQDLQLKKHGYGLKRDGDYLYYLNSQDKNKLYRMSLTQDQNEKLLEHTPNEYEIYNNNLYYQNLNDGARLYKLDLKTHKEIRLSEYPVKNLVQSDEGLFVTLTMGGTLLFDVDDDKDSLLFHSFCSHFGTEVLLEDGIIYQLVQDEGGNSLLIRNLEEEKVVGKYSIDGWVYYYNWTWKSTGYLYAIHNESRKIKWIVKDSLTNYCIDGNDLFYGNNYYGGYISYLNLKTGEFYDIEATPTSTALGYYDFLVLENQFYYLNTDQKGDGKIKKYDRKNNISTELKGSYHASDLLGGDDTLLVFYDYLKGYYTYNLLSSEVKPLLEDINYTYMGCDETNLYVTKTEDAYTYVYKVGIRGTDIEKVVEQGYENGNFYNHYVFYTEKNNQKLWNVYDIKKGTKTQIEMEANEYINWDYFNEVLRYGGSM
ncbi:MAG: hypothetical protein CVU84_10165 [Firmicutes bacterium HGW-Firmicutes-1]|jgi:hypothetical protein|nr:MAG: hypothetical protein CVU84_10165 [Firmicutes bacterium HGW-Firmicutes-1]